MTSTVCSSLWLAALLLAISPLAHPEDLQRWAVVDIPPVRASLDGTDVGVAMATPAEIQVVRDLSPMGAIVAGMAGSMLAFVQPVYALSPLLAVFGPPMSASFAARQRAVASAIAREPLPARLLSALEQRWRTRLQTGPTRLDIRIASYGLVPKGKAPTVFAPNTPMCLAAQFLVTADVGDKRVLTEALTIGLEPALRSSDAPPPICASLAHFTDSDALYLGQSIRELAAVAAAMTMTRIARVE